jgi:hypothetical protein
MMTAINITVKLASFEAEVLILILAFLATFTALINWMFNTARKLKGNKNITNRFK